jgi:hypothetical protein
VAMVREKLQLRTQRSALVNSVDQLSLQTERPSAMRAARAAKLGGVRQRVVVQAYVAPL